MCFLFYTSVGPKKITLSDFWQMIWQENVDTIVMVTKLMEGEKVKIDTTLMKMRASSFTIIIRKSQSSQF